MSIHRSTQQANHNKRSAHEPTEEGSSSHPPIGQLSTASTTRGQHTKPQERSAACIHSDVIARSSEGTMADVFSLNDARKLLKNRFMLMIGDSNTRAIYKDLLCLLHEGVITPEVILRRGSEAAPQYGDEIIDTAATMFGRGYFEVRQCKRRELWVRFIFVTQAAAPTLLKELDRLEASTLPPPAIVILNSCLWDLTRWGPEQEDQYKRNVAKLFHRLRSLLPPSSIVVWLASLPVATERVKGGVFIQQIEFIKHSMRFMLLEANMFMHNLCQVFGFNFLDLHYYMQFQLNRRTNDGLHWEPPAIRFITNLVLTHIALCLNDPLPGNISDTFLLRLHSKARQETKDDNKIYLDSKIVKYLREKLGIEVKNLAEGEEEEASSPEKEKEQREKRVKRKARRTTTKNNKNKNSSQPAPATQQSFLQPEMIDLPPKHGQQDGAVRPRGPSVPPWVRRHQQHMAVWGYQDGANMNQQFPGMQMQGAYGQYFGDGAGPSDFRQRPAPWHESGSQFSSMQMTWEITDYGHQSMNMMPPQPYQPEFSHNPVEFWRDYNVNNFPWNQQQ